jgi:HEAT repeat protein
MSACPVCGKAVDPLRAPAVAVVGGKVVGFCSKEHAASASSGDSRPVARKDATPIPKRRDRDATPVPSKKTRTPPAGVTTPASLLDSGPVIEIIHEPASGVVTSAPDARDARSGPTQAADRAETSGAIEIAETGHLDDYVSQDEPRRSRGWLALLVLVVLGGGAFAAYQLGYLDALFDTSSHAATPPTHSAASETPPAPAPAAVPTLAAPVAVDAARELLHAAITSPASSPRVQRLAAAALARTGASEAVVPLIAALPKETSNTARLDIYYALARGADRRGTDGLVASLASSSRDDKLDAARRLAMLGDKRAAAVLVPYLDVAQQRLGAAESLAYLGDARAIQTLEQIRADATASAADKAEAAVALGIAGKSSAAPALRALLTDPHFNAFAATALAELHDQAAKPVLTKQLAVPALRVEAARGLRRLDPSIDATALLPKLVAEAKAATGAEQVQAAEAVLVLAGPPTWSERP